MKKMLIRMKKTKKQKRKRLRRRRIEERLMTNIFSRLLGNKLKTKLWNIYKPSTKLLIRRTVFLNSSRENSMAFTSRLKRAITRTLPLFQVLNCSLYPRRR
jgi:hypothetical protein